MPPINRMTANAAEWRKWRPSMHVHPRLALQIVQSIKSVAQELDCRGATDRRDITATGLGDTPKGGSTLWATLVKQEWAHS